MPSTNPAHQRIEVALDRSDVRTLNGLIATYNKVPPFNKSQTVNTSDVVRHALQSLEKHVANLRSLDAQVNEMAALVAVMLPRRLGRGRPVSKQQKQ